MRKLIVISMCILLVLSGCGGEKEKATAEEQPATDEKPANVNAPTSKEEKEETYDATENTTPEFFPWNCQDFSVPAGTNIGLFYEWGTKTEEQNEKYFNVTEHTVYVNDVPIRPIMDGLNGIEDDGDGNFKQLYWIDIGNYPAGTYTLHNVIEVTEPVFDGWDWYGPDSDYPTMESGCTVTVTESGVAAADEGEAVAEPLATCSIDSPIREEWDIALCETFETDTVLWLGTDQGTTTRLESGQYLIDNTTGVSQGYTTGFIFPVTAGNAPNHMISVDGELDSNFKDCTWGVYVRSTANEIVYFFMINNQGRYTFTGSTENDAARYLGNIDAGSNNSIVWDGVNNITGVADGKELEFYINGDLVVTHEANNDYDSEFGVIVWGGEGVTAVTKLDNMLVRVN